jgi:hypothetical protein
MYESTTEQCSSHQWEQRLNHHLQKVHTVSRYTAIFTNWCHRYIQKRQIDQDMDTYILSRV